MRATPPYPQRVFMQQRLPVVWLLRRVTRNEATPPHSQRVFMQQRRFTTGLSPVSLGGDRLAFVNLTMPS